MTHGVIRRVKLRVSSDTALVKRKAIELLEVLTKQRGNHDEVSMSVSKLLALSFTLAVLGLMFLSFDVMKRKEH